MGTIGAARSLIQRGSNIWLSVVGRDPNCPTAGGSKPCEYWHNWAATYILWWWSASHCRKAAPFLAISNQLSYDNDLGCLFSPTPSLCLMTASIKIYDKEYLIHIYMTRWKHHETYTPTACDTDNMSGMSRPHVQSLIITQAICLVHLRIRLTWIIATCSIATLQTTWSLWHWNVAKAVCSLKRFSDGAVSSELETQGLTHLPPPPNISLYLWILTHLYISSLPWSPQAQMYHSTISTFTVDTQNINLYSLKATRCLNHQLFQSLDKMPLIFIHGFQSQLCGRLEHFWCCSPWLMLPLRHSGMVKQRDLQTHQLVLGLSFHNLTFAIFLGCHQGSSSADL